MREQFTSLRTRLNARILTAGGATGFIQLQDVRLFGESANTLTDYSADGMDLHQGWILLGQEAAGSSLKVGRQEVALGGERLVGAVGWAQQGRAFDGVRARVRPSQGFTVDFLGLQVAEAVAPAHDVDAFLWGAYGTLKASGGQSLDLFVLVQDDGREVGPTNQVTWGARHVGAGGPFTYRFEGALQSGTRGGRDVSASLVGGRVAAAVGRGSVGVWYDRLSGNQPGSAEVGAFETLYATNHKFYGFADLFTNIPAHTAGRGLADAAVKGSVPLGAWTLAADLHRFSVVEESGLASGHLADELDLTVSRRLPSGVAVTTGVSYVWSGDALAVVRGIRQDVFFGYIMLDLGF